MADVPHQQGIGSATWHIDPKLLTHIHPASPEVWRTAFSNFAFIIKNDTNQRSWSQFFYVFYHITECELFIDAYSVLKSFFLSQIWQFLRLTADPMWCNSIVQFEEALFVQKRKRDVFLLRTGGGSWKTESFGCCLGSARRSRVVVEVVVVIMLSCTASTLTSFSDN